MSFRIFALKLLSQSKFNKYTQKTKFLIPSSRYLELDIQTLKRIEDISKLPDDSKDYIYNIIDIALRDFKTRKAYA